MLIQVKGRTGHKQDYLPLGVQTNIGSVEEVMHRKAVSWAPKRAKSYKIIAFKHTDYYGAPASKETGYASFEVQYFTTAKEGSYPVASLRENPSASAEKIRKAIARSKREILKDVADGIVPAGVRSFSQLHDYIDANCYGGLCTERGYMSIPDANAVQNAVDRWIKVGGIRKATRR